jgi:translation elongation factor EF-G
MQRLAAAFAKLSREDMTLSFSINEATGRSGTIALIARAPLAELFGYDSDLRHKTMGRGAHSRVSSPARVRLLRHPEPVGRR